VKSDRAVAPGFLTTFFIARRWIMMSLAVDRSFECAPHATRSFALALTLSLNLAVVLFALLPSTPFPVQAPPPQSLLAAVLPQLPPPVAPPTVPILRVAEHRVATPSVHVPLTRPVPISLPNFETVAPILPAQTAATTTGSDTGAAGNAEASIAYETATPPAYPLQALREGVQGTVLLKVLVAADGMPVQVVVERGSGSRLLDDAARRHVLAAWRFHPAMRDGHAIEAWALVPVRFALNRG
jgi:protein TonB